jgi:precorrin-6B methylase 2
MILSYNKFKIKGLVLSNKQINIDLLIDEATKLRDELALQVNLGSAEASDELEKLNNKYEIFKSKSKDIFEVAENSADELKIAGELGINAKDREELLIALELAAEEIKDGYKQITKIL